MTSNGVKLPGIGPIRYASRVALLAARANDVFDDGVNVEARLEGIAMLGGIALSDGAFAWHGIQPAFAARISPA